MCNDHVSDAIQNSTTPDTSRGSTLHAGSHQSLGQRSKTRTSLADTGSASGATFQCMQFLPFLSIFPDLFYLGHLSLLGLQRLEDRATLLLSAHSSHILSAHSSHTLEIFKSFAMTVFVCMLSAGVQKSTSCKKWETSSFGPIPVIQSSFYSLCVALAWNEVFPSSGSRVTCPQNIRNFSTGVFA